MGDGRFVAEPQKTTKKNHKKHTHALINNRHQNQHEMINCQLPIKYQPLHTHLNIIQVTCDELLQVEEA